MSLFDSKNVRITQVEVENPDAQNQEDFTNAQNLPEVTETVTETPAVEIPVNETPIIQQQEQARLFPESQTVQKPEKEKKYNWAFFCASMFMGIALGEMMNVDSFVLFGIGGGFLFFVDPIYQKVMDKINKM